MELGMELERRQVPMGLLPQIHVVHRRGGMSRLRKFTEKDWGSNPKQIRGAILNRYRTLFRHNRLFDILFRLSMILFYNRTSIVYDLLLLSPLYNYMYSYLLYLLLYIILFYHFDYISTTNNAIKNNIQHTISSPLPPLTWALPKAP